MQAMNSCFCNRCLNDDLIMDASDDLSSIFDIQNLSCIGKQHIT
jgi:hypothetical protein